jgi:serine protease AprX
VRRFLTASLGLAALLPLLPAGPTAPVVALVDAEVAALSGPTTVLAHVADGHDLADLTLVAAGLGLETVSVYERIGVSALAGDAAAIQALATTGVVERLEHDAPIRVFTDTSHTATRGQSVLDGSVTLNGTIIDGAGVGVAVVDSGVDGLHPDLVDRMGGNVKVLPGGIAVPLPDTDTVSLGGHGTHVAGIVAGTGDASEGEFHGAAPGATVYGVSAGTLISLHSALDGLEWVLDNHDRVSPAIRVVNNSWGSAAGAYNPNDATHQLAEALIAEGVVVVFAAGNDGGNGATQTTSVQCVNPTPGHLCVSAYDDRGTGTRNGTMASFSSRGRNGDPATYPDLAAPGANIVAACTPTKPVCLTGSLGAPDPLNYASLSGTSMAAPHIAGIVAQLLQADPALTPADVEDVLEDTATPFSGSAHTADPSNPGGTFAHDEGHGLVDVVAAVTAALAR